MEQRGSAVQYSPAIAHLARASTMGEIYVGQVVRVESGYCFAASKACTARYGRDVFLHGAWQLGDWVKFSVSLNEKQQPVAIFSSVQFLGQEFKDSEDLDGEGRFLQASSVRSSGGWGCCRRRAPGDTVTPTAASTPLLSDDVDR